MRVIDEPMIKTSVSEKREVRSVIETCEIHAVGKAIEGQSIVESCEVQLLTESGEIKTLEMTSVVESCDVNVLHEARQEGEQSVAEKPYEQANEPFTRISDEGS